MRPVEITWPGVLATLAVFVVAAACVRLGFWQLDRRDARQAVNTVVTERLREPALELSRVPHDTAGLTYRRATLRGRYDNDRTLIIAGRSRGGAPGVHVYAPLRAGGGDAILVNRGWLPSRDAATVDLAPVRVDTAVIVSGLLMPFPDIDVDRDPRPDFQTTWFRLDADAIRGQFPYPVSGLYLVAEPGADVPEQGPLPAEPPTLDAGPHLSYAFQWFSFAAIALIGWTVLALRPQRNMR